MMDLGAARSAEKGGYISSEGGYSYTQCKSCKDVYGYNDQKGQTICKGYPAGKYNNKNSIPSQWNAQTDWQSTDDTNFDNANDCTSSCPRGKYKEDAVRGGCKACPRGLYQNYVRKESCILCPVAATMTCHLLAPG